MLHVFLPIYLIKFIQQISTISVDLFFGSCSGNTYVLYKYLLLLTTTYYFSYTCCQLLENMSKVLVKWKLIYNCRKNLFGILKNYDVFSCHLYFLLELYKLYVHMEELPIYTKIFVIWLVLYNFAASTYSIVTQYYKRQLTFLIYTG